MKHISNLIVYVFSALVTITAIVFLFNTNVDNKEWLGYWGNVFGSLLGVLGTFLVARTEYKHLAKEKQAQIDQQNMDKIRELKNLYFADACVFVHVRQLSNMLIQNANEVIKNNKKQTNENRNQDMNDSDLDAQKIIKEENLKKVQSKTELQKTTFELIQLVMSVPSSDINSSIISNLTEWIDKESDVYSIDDIQLHIVKELKIENLLN